MTLERREVHCVIRNSGNGWGILNDIGHLPIGVSSLVQLPDRVEVIFDFVAKKVHSFAVVPDETYAALDQYVAGASVGFDKAVIFFARPTVNSKVNPANIANPSGNFFVAGFFSVEC